MRRVSEDLASGYQVTLQAAGWSMLPLLWDQRDKLTLAPVTPETFSPGRVVLACIPPERYVVHRIASISGDRIKLRGDGNPYQQEECTRSDVLGELVSIVRDGVTYTPEDRLWQRIGRYWPSTPIVRRIALALYKRMFITHKLRMTREVKRRYRF